MQDKERQERILEKKRRLGMPIKGEVLTREEQEARIWAFMYALVFFGVCPQSLMDGLQES